VCVRERERERVCVCVSFEDSDISCCSNTQRDTESMFALLCCSLCLLDALSLSGREGESVCVCVCVKERQCVCRCVRESVCVYACVCTKESEMTSRSNTHRLMVRLIVEACVFCRLYLSGTSRLPERESQREKKYVCMYVYDVCICICVCTSVFMCIHVCVYIYEDI